MSYFRWLLHAPTVYQPFPSTSQVTIVPVDISMMLVEPEQKIQISVTAYWDSVGWKRASGPLLAD